MKYPWYLFPLWALASLWQWLGDAMRFMWEQAGEFKPPEQDRK